MSGCATTGGECGAGGYCFDCHERKASNKPCGPCRWLTKLSDWYCGRFDAYPRTNAEGNPLRVRDCLVSNKERND